MRRDTDRTPAGRIETVTRRGGAGDESVASRESGQRYTVREAALLLGLSVDAVRKRAERGRLKREKDPDGTVYILLDPDQPAVGHGTRHIRGDATLTSRDALISGLQDQIEYLRRELDIRNEELRRKDSLLATALERIPEVEAAEKAPSEDPASSEGALEPRDAPETATSAPGEVVREEGAWEERHQEGREAPEHRRSWLYRFFFGP